MLFVLSLEFKRLSIRRLFGYTACFIFGFSPYLLLMRAAQYPLPGSWGDTRSFQGLLKHFLRAEYGSLRLAPTDDATNEGFWERNVAFLEDSILLFQPYGLPIAVAAFGLAVSWRFGEAKRVRSRQFEVLMVVSFCFYFVVFHSLANLSLSLPMPREVHRRFWIQPHLFTS